jgi:hypothetical protein
MNAPHELALGGTHDLDRLRRRDVIADFELPADLLEFDGFFERRGLSRDVASANGYFRSRISSTLRDRMWLGSVHHSLSKVVIWHECG